MPYHCSQPLTTAFALLTALTLSLLTLQPTQAQSPHPIDSWLEQQLDQDYSTAGMCSALAEGTARWDKELNAVYSRLLKSLTPAQVKTLKTAQRAWITFRDAEIAAITSIVASQQGTMYRVEAANLHYELTKQRTLQLLAYED